MASRGGDLEVAEDVASELGLEVSGGSWSKIDKMLELMEKYADSLNLSGARGRPALLEHVSEALVALAAANRAGVGAGDWVDVGSGGGFPGLVVAAVWPGQVTLVEPRARRAAFLELVLSSIGVRAGASVRRARLRSGQADVLDGGGKLRRGFAVASARAVFTPNAWLAEAANWVAANGVCLVHLHSALPEHLPGDLRAEARAGRWLVQAYVPRGTVERGRDPTQ